MGIKKTGIALSRLTNFFKPLGFQLNNRQWWLEVTVLAFGYAILVFLVIKKIPIISKTASPFWPAAGWAIAGLLMWGRSRWWGISFGAFFANYFIFHHPLFRAAVYALMPCIGAVITVTAILYFTKTKYPFLKVKDVAIFIFCVLFTGTFIQPFISNPVAIWFGRDTWSTFIDKFFRQWIGDSIGVLFFAPFVLALGSREQEKMRKPLWHWEVLLTLISMIAIAYFSLIKDQPVSYLFILPVLWSAFRLGSKITTFLVAIIGFSTSIFTGYGQGFFYEQAVTNNSILLLQLFVGVISITAMAVLAIVSENRQANLALQRANIELEQRVLDRTQQLQESEAKAIKLAERAEAANHAKSTFIANMSHELRSPLNAVLGFSQLMIRASDLPPAQHENAGIIYRSGDYLLTLINNVLDLSKIEADKITLDIHNFDLYQLLNDLEEMLFLKAQNKGVDLHFSYDSSLPRYFSGDPVKLRQVLINLLNNAIKFTQDGQVKLTIESRQIADYQYELGFAIADTGVGIDPAELSFLFEAFTQTKSGINAQEGTGLGLAISQKFVQLMGGEITVQSELGKGSIFRFNIRTQLGQETTEQISKNHRVIALAPNQPTYKILTVDDKPINCQLLIKLLSPLGFEVKTASNGQEAIALWESWKPDLILMDMRMPIMDGYEATKQIKNRSKGEKAVIVALTASVLEEEQAVVLACGCDDFIRKPFTEKIIFETLTKHLGVAYLYQDISQTNQNPLSEGTVTTQSSPLTINKLQHLDKNWLHQLYTGASEADFNQVMRLLEDLPPEEIELIDALIQLARQFQFDRIIDLVVPLLKNFPLSNDVEQ